MRPKESDSRPAGNGPANKSLGNEDDSTARNDIPGLTFEQSLILHNWIADANGVLPDRVALVAMVETPGGTYRRRVFLSLAAAQNALERAAERGLEARVLLCELVPVGGDSR